MLLHGVIRHPCGSSLALDRSGCFNNGVLGCKTGSFKYRAQSSVPGSGCHFVVYLSYSTEIRSDGLCLVYEVNNVPSFFIDEIQYFSKAELNALIMAMHKMQQRQLPLVLVGAGLPILPGLAGNAKSYAERLFSFPDIGPLQEEDAAKALQDPVRAEGVAFEPAALQEIYRMTKGYPYFLQEWGYQAWNQSESSPITLRLV